MPSAPSLDVLHLQAGGVSVVIGWSREILPIVLYWGSAVELRGSDLLTTVESIVPPQALNAADRPIPTSVLPDSSRGWSGLPGVRGHRESLDWAPRFADVDVQRDDIAAAQGPAAESQTVVIFRAADTTAGLELRLRLELTAEGILRAQATLTNTAKTDYILDGVDLAFPLPDRAVEVLDFAGRWGDERTAQRGAIRYGAHVRESRRGRTGHDSAHLMIAGEGGFGYRHGEVWGLHVAWSGNQRSQIIKAASGEQFIGGGELLLPGEIRLTPGQSYTTPQIWAAWGAGLDDQAARLHATVRREASTARIHRGPRPVTLNVWEAVYFDHDLERLKRLADLAAEIGVERFVLDDGWFLGRRDDTTGLGDWIVDPSVWPEGLTPLVDHVRALGMQFGLWFEPEMISDASQLGRAHPDWRLQVPGRAPLESRHQQVLDLTRDEAFDHVRSQIDELIDRYDIDYIKWDHNRDLIDPGDSRGHAAVHRQTRAFYRLLAHLHVAHPDLEIESCSSGGARIDLAVIGHVDRFWASDNNDPIDRFRINAWTAQLVPTEYIGSHVASGHNHVTGRRSSLELRALSALPWHFGIEADLEALTEHDRAELRTWVARHKRLRELTHSGTLVRSDDTPNGQLLHGWVSRARREAVYLLVTLDTLSDSLGSVLRFPGLEPGVRYELRIDSHREGALGNPPLWFAAASRGLQISGALLGSIGLRMPALNPGDFLIFTLRAATRSAPTPPSSTTTLREDRND